MSDLEKTLIQLQCELVSERNLVNLKDLSWLQYDILNLLSRKRDLSPSVLSSYLNIRPSKFSKEIKDLRNKKYITQEVSRSDGRSLVTNITDDGLAFLNSVSERHEFLYETALQIFSVEEQRIFTDLASKLNKALEQERIKVK
jgi:DNA-binding MarR family transcriptional regulator